MTSLDFLVVPDRFFLSHTILFVNTIEPCDRFFLKFSDSVSNFEGMVRGGRYVTFRY